MIAQKRLKAIVVNLVTGVNLLMGVASILLSSMGHGRLAVACLLVGMLFDAFDGLLARYWGVFSKIGAELDSLADLTSFVVANAVLIFFWFRGGVDLYLQIVAGAVFTLCGAFRLARFNVYPTSGGVFQGIPTTGAALLIAAIYLTYPNLQPVYGLSLQVLLGLLMISSLPYPKIGQLRLIPWPFYLLLGFFACWDIQKATAIGCSLYIVSGLIAYLRRKDCSSSDST